MLASFIPESVLGMLILPLLLAGAILVGRTIAGSLGNLAFHSFLERLLAYMLIGTIAVSWLGTILAYLGWFHWWTLVPSLLLLAGGRAWRSRHHDSVRIPPVEVKPTPRLVQLLLILILIGAGWLFARPAESFLTSDDAAIYTNGGIVLARTGSLFFQQETIYDMRTVPPRRYWDPPTGYTTRSHIDFARQFSNSEDVILTRHFGPFFQWSFSRNRVEIGYLPLPKVWTALQVWLFGVAHATWAVSFFGFLGLVALYGFVRRLRSWPTALMTIVILGISLPQVWFSRFPLSEAYTQALVLGGLYLAVLARQSQTQRSAYQVAVWSSLSLAALTILRLEALIILVILVVVRLAHWQKERSNGEILRVSLVVLLFAVGLGTLMGVMVSPFYLFTRSMAVISHWVDKMVYGVILGAIILGAIVWDRVANQSGRLVTAGRLVLGATPRLIGWGWVAWIALSIWHLVTRSWSLSLAGWLAQYWSLYGLILAACGVLWLVWHNRDRTAQPELDALLGLSVFFLLLYALNALVTPTHPWAMRRLMPFVLPTLALCTAVPLVEGVKRLPWDRLRARSQRLLRPLASAIAVAALLAQVLLLGLRTRPILLHQERQGFYHQMETLATKLPKGAVLLFDNGLVGERMTQAMELIYGFPSFVLRDTEAIHSDSAIVDRLIESAHAQQRPVYLIIADGNLSWHPAHWSLLSRGVVRFDNAVLRYVWGRPPNAGDIGRHVFYVDLYEITAAGQTAEIQGARTINIPMGAGSYSFLRQGVYGLEVNDKGEEYRWTQGEVEIVVPWPAPEADHATGLCLTLDLSPWRPPDRGAPYLQVEVEGFSVFAEELDGATGRQTLTIPLAGVENRGSPELEVRLHLNTWCPATAPGQGDTRDLGVVLYGLQVSPAACPQ